MKHTILTHWKIVVNIYSSKKMLIGIEINDIKYLMKKVKLLQSAKTVNSTVNQKILTVYHQRKIRRQLLCTWKIFKQVQKMLNRFSEKECRLGFFKTSLNISSLLALKLKQKLILNFKL